MRFRIFSKILLIFTAIISSAFAQIRLSPGIQVGTPLTDTLISSSYLSSGGTPSSFDRYNSVTKRLLIGPSLRLELPRGLGLEFDALYQRVDYDDASGTELSGGYSSQSFEQATANRWQFPLLLQYSRKMGKISPFIEAGPSISAIAGGHSAFTGTSVSPSSTPSTSSYTGTFAPSVSAGITMGGGVTFVHHLRAGIRFSHWFRNTGGYATPVERSGDFLTVGDALTGIFIPPQISGEFPAHANEASFLLGLFF